MSSAVFPSLPGLGYSVTRSLIWKSLTQTAVSGDETRVQLWSYPRYQYTLTFDVLRTAAAFAEFQTLLGFINARGGAYDSFLFEDVDDNSVAGQPIGIFNGTATQTQLVRGLGGFTEPVFAPHTVSRVYLNGTPVSSGSWSVSATGLVTFTSAPASGALATADFTYYWPVRFVGDQTDFEKFASRRYAVKKLDLITLKNWP
jgi:uncharacterized protein (TIGR02217 family)